MKSDVREKAGISLPQALFTPPKKIKKQMTTTLISGLGGVALSATAFGTTSNTTSSTTSNTTSNTTSSSSPFPISMSGVRLSVGTPTPLFPTPTATIAPPSSGQQIHELYPGPYVGSEGKLVYFWSETDVAEKDKKEEIKEKDGNEEKSGKESGVDEKVKKVEKVEKAEKVEKVEKVEKIDNTENLAPPTATSTETSTATATPTTTPTTTQYSAEDIALIESMDVIITTTPVKRKSKPKSDQNKAQKIVKTAPTGNNSNSKSANNGGSSSSSGTSSVSGSGSVSTAKKPSLLNFFTKNSGSSSAVKTATSTTTSATASVTGSAEVEQNNNLELISHSDPGSTVTPHSTESDNKVVIEAVIDTEKGNEKEKDIVKKSEIEIINLDEDSKL